MRASTAEQEYAVKRLESALKSFGPGFHVYQYLLKTSRPEIPFADYDDPVVRTAVDRPRRFFAEKADHLYQIEIYYCVVLEGSRSKTGLAAGFAHIFRDPAAAAQELQRQFTNNSMKTLLRSQIERDLAQLEQRTRFCNAHIRHTDVRVTPCRLERIAGSRGGDH